MLKLPFVGSYGAKLHGPFKVSQVRPACSSKQASALHELYVRFCVGIGNGSSGLSKVIDTETRESSSEDEQPKARKLTPNNSSNTVIASHQCSEGH